MANKYDFVGWATKNDLLCSDGRTIRKGAFKDCDGMVVPLVWNHQHNDPENVLGHALLKNEDVLPIKADEKIAIIGGFAEKKAGEDIATAKALRAYGKKMGKRYGCLRRNHLINSTRKYDDMGDWLYFRLSFRNAGALIKAAFGDSSEYDKLMDEMFYDYNDNRAKSS